MRRKTRSSASRLHVSGISPGSETTRLVVKFVGSFVLLATGGCFVLALFYPGIADQVWSIIGHCISAATGALGCLLAVRTRK